MQKQKEMVKKFDECQESLLSTISIIEDTPKQVKINILQQKKLKIDKNKKAMQLRKREQQRKEYDTLATKYKDFHVTLSSNVAKLIEKYNIEWKDCEKEWFNWDIDILVQWFEYILNKNDKTKDDDLKIDFNQIQDKMKSEKYKSKNLVTLDYNRQCVHNVVRIVRG